MNSLIVLLWQLTESKHLFSCRSESSNISLVVILL
jgi:hypothetical protein